MQKGSRTTIVIVIVAVIAALAAWWYWSQNQVPAPETAITPEATSTPETQTATTLPSGKDSSDTGLALDFSAVDTEMSAFAADNSSINGSLSDQPVQQSSL